MKKYTQLTMEEREKLFHLRASEPSLAQIARKMGRHPSTISRELKRNQSPSDLYLPDTAQRKANKRRCRGCRIDAHPDLKAFILEKLQCHRWTPEQISAYLQYRQKELPPVSCETIYTWIYQKPQVKNKLWKYLVRHKAKRGIRKPRGAGVSRIPNRVSIHDRPPLGGPKRKLFGHWEGDLMSFRKNAQHILVIRERKSMLTLSCVLENKRADTTSAAMMGLLENIPEGARKTITFDNGNEFAGHTKLAEALGLKTFFCDPYKSWQKGGVENSNERLRRDLPRKTNVKKMTQEDFDETIENYNSTPRKKLKWLTPIEAFNKNLENIALQT